MTDEDDRPLFGKGGRAGEQTRRWDDWLKANPAVGVPVFAILFFILFMLWIWKFRH